MARSWPGNLWPEGKISLAPCVWRTSNVFFHMSTCHQFDDREHWVWIPIKQNVFPLPRSISFLRLLVLQKWYLYVLITFYHLITTFLFFIFWNSSKTFVKMYFLPFDKIIDFASWHTKPEIFIIACLYRKRLLTLGVISYWLLWEHISF